MPTLNWAKLKRDPYQPPVNHSLRLPIGKQSGNIFLDVIEIDLSGLIRLSGWCSGEVDPASLPAVSLGGVAVPFLQFFRLHRPDVPFARTGPFHDLGVALEYLVSDGNTSAANQLELRLPGGEILQFPLSGPIVVPHYAGLFNSTGVLHREHIYGSGLPNQSVHPELRVLAKTLRGKTLDFGCGQGMLVEELRSTGLDAYGLELDSEVIRTRIKPQLKPYITLYDGALPSPFATGSFESVICSEVLEHIPDYEAALAEIARLTTSIALFTVPDASAIPLGARHGAVPWHLMEATHVNFFSQTSLHAALRPWFSRIEFSRVGSAQFNETRYFVSLVAQCRK